MNGKLKPIRKNQENLEIRGDLIDGYQVQQQNLKTATLQFQGSIQFLP